LILTEAIFMPHTKNKDSSQSKKRFGHAPRTESFSSQKPKRDWREKKNTHFKKEIPVNTRMTPHLV
jgi:hypothetical protein